MPQNWKTYSLADMTSVITKGTTPSTYGYNFEEDGINFIKSESLNYDGRVDIDAFAKISEEAHEKLRRSQLKEKDILFSMAGAYLGKTGMVKKDYCPANTNQAVGIIRIKHPEVLPKFIALALRNPSNVAFVNSLSGQSAQPNINLTEIGELSFSLPPLPIQRHIASILGAIDDKIELNLEINKTLEEMAMALYKHWFVDFGPFKQTPNPSQEKHTPNPSQEGNYIGEKSIDTTQIHPRGGQGGVMYENTPVFGSGKFVNSELGMIPEGWEVKKLKEISSINANTYRNGELPNIIKYVDISSVKTGSIEGLKKIYKEEAPSRARRKVFDGDTLWSSVRPNRKSYYLAIGMPTNTVASTGFTILSSGDAPYSFLHLLSTTKEFVDYLVRNSRGAAYPAVTGKDFENYLIAWPGSEIVNSFHSIASPLLELKSQNDIESQNLVEIRGTLLPKLISGEVQVKEAEEEVSKVV